MRGFDKIEQQDKTAQDRLADKWSRPRRTTRGRQALPQARAGLEDQRCQMASQPAESPIFPNSKPPGACQPDEVRAKGCSSGALCQVQLTTLFSP